VYFDELRKKLGKHESKMKESVEESPCGWKEAMKELRCEWRT